MTIWLQKSASIQKRTSPLKFDHFRYPKPDFTASNLSTKAWPAPPTPSSCTPGFGGLTEDADPDDEFGP